MISAGVALCWLSMPDSVSTAVNTAGGAGLAHDHLAEPGQRGPEPRPDPARQVFAGRVFEPRYLIQITMIELLEQRLERATDIGEVLHPTESRIRWSGHIRLDTKRMSVQPITLVVHRQMGQSVCRFDGEELENFHAEMKT